MCLPFPLLHYTGDDTWMRRLLRPPFGNRSLWINGSQIAWRCRMLSLFILRTSILCSARKIFLVLLPLCWLEASPLSILWNTLLLPLQICGSLVLLLAVPLCWCHTFATATRVWWAEWVVMELEYLVITFDMFGNFWQASQHRLLLMASRNLV
jgi:hypothetical protein